MPLAPKCYSLSSAAHLLFGDGGVKQVKEGFFPLAEESSKGISLSWGKKEKHKIDRRDLSRV